MEPKPNSARKSPELIGRFSPEQAERLCRELETRLSNEPLPLQWLETQCHGIITRAFEDVREQVSRRISRPLEVTLAEVNVPPRALQMLERLDIATVGDLLARSTAELYSIAGFGAASLKGVKKALIAAGIRQAHNIEIPDKEKLLARTKQRK